MSEPRKLYTGSASGGLDQEQYEAARRRAQQLAEQNARRRTVQQPMRTAQGRHISQRPVVTEQPAPAPEPPVQERAQQAAPAPEKPRELTYAQRQAMAYRAAAERKHGDTLQFQVQRRRRFGIVDFSMFKRIETGSAVKGMDVAMRHRRCRPAHRLEDGKQIGMRRRADCIIGQQSMFDWRQTGVNSLVEWRRDRRQTGVESPHASLTGFDSRHQVPTFGPRCIVSQPVNDDQTDFHRHGWPSA